MKKVYTLSAAKSSSTPYSKEITADILVSVLRGDSPYEPWIPYLDIFFNELPQKIFLGTLRENGISKEMAYKVYSKLPKALQIKNIES